MKRLAVAVALLATSASAAELQTFTLRPVVLIESHLYEGPLQGPESVFFDAARKEIWVADTRASLIGVFGEDGMPLFAFASRDKIREPRQVAVDPQGRVVILEHDRSRLRLFNYRGVYLGDVVPPNLPEKGQIAAFAFGGSGLLYIGEATAGEIQIYDYATMKLKRRFGTRGEDEGEFRSIAALAADEKHVYVLDHTGIAVQVFTARGDFVRGWGQHAMGGANFSLPRGIAVDAKGRIATVDALRHDIKYFDIEGKFVGHFGGAGRRPGSVSFPTAIAVSPDGRVFVAERGNARVQVFQEEPLEQAITVP
jgi:DNA-binding beta-propeller fold protein YncE